MKQRKKLKAEAKDHSGGCADNCLQDLKRKLEQGIFRRTVDKGSSKRITCYHDERTQRNAETCAKRFSFVTGENMAGAEGNHNRLEAMRY